VKSLKVSALNKYWWTRRSCNWATLSFQSHG